MHRRTVRWAACRWAASGVIALGLLLGGCATSPTEEPMTTRPEPPPTEPAASDLPGVREAIAAEAQRQGVSTDEVEVVSHADVVWSDGSVGCPQPGMMYAQALVPGRLLVLKVGDELASYHSAGAGFSYCADPIPPLPPEADQSR